MSTHHSTDYGYYVQVRSTHNMREPLRLGRTLVARDWQRVGWSRRPLAPASDGVGVTARAINPVARENGVLTYAHAHAMVAGALASLPMGGVFLEFRLEKVKVVYDWEITPEGVGPVVDLSKAERDEEFKEES